MLSTRKWQVLAILSAGAALYVGCASSDDGADEGPACEASYPPTAATSLIHVAGSCSGKGAKGTAERPYRTIQDAIDAAEEGTTIVIEAGTYAENLVVQTSGLTLAGAADGAMASEAAVTLEAPNNEMAAVYLVEASDTTVRGLNIVSPGVAGIWVQGGSANVEGVVVSDAAGDKEGAFGFGVLAADVSGIWIQRSAITGSSNVGVHVAGATGEASVQGSALEGNGRGGIRMERVQNGGKVTGNAITANFELGIGLFSCVGIWIQDNTVEDTQKGGPAQAADGIIVAELNDGDGVSHGASEVIIGGDEASVEEALGNQISGNARVGLLLSGEVSSIVMSNNADANQRAGIWIQRSAGKTAGIWIQEEAEAAGIWIQDEAETAGIWIQDNGLNGNSYMGISIGAGTMASAIGNAVENTTAGAGLIEPNGIQTVFMGDAIGVFAGATARVEGNALNSNARLAVLGDGLSSDSSFHGNEMVGNATGSVAFQGVNAADMPSGDDAAGVSPATAGSFSVVSVANDPEGFPMGTESANTP